MYIQRMLFSEEKKPIRIQISRNDFFRENNHTIPIVYDLTDITFETYDF